MSFDCIFAVWPIGSLRYVVRRVTFEAPRISAALAAAAANIEKHFPAKEYSRVQLLAAVRAKREAA